MAQSAPAICFRHHLEIPVNEFEIGHKLEVTSSVSHKLVHLATVVGMVGPRLQLRLDGCHNKMDCFKLVDNNSIRPVGTHKSRGCLLGAPLFFGKCITKYGRFCQQVLENSVHAPPNCFKKAPKIPDRNYFQPGMKLEVSDIDRPNQIVPATIKSVDGVNVLIHMDGWPEDKDYHCPYYSRSLFPVGWCQKTGHVLQPPGPYDERIISAKNNNKQRQQKRQQQQQPQPNVGNGGRKRKRKTTTSTPVDGKPSGSNAMNRYKAQLPPRAVVHQWPVDELVQFLKMRFPQFHRFEQKFRSHEIDGHAFLLLTDHDLMKYLGVNKSHTLKMIDLIEKINFH
ncbi:Sterile alpha motif(SAM)/Pointed domain [Dermatophagoides farinae]|uniref:Sterile alpha motif(SAM)/Pointed domain n=1 Tax=Dermatophagoides farinae TaxID=6954 RepID=A0A922L4P3_DERFA|nr:Sterile alpha motif(SAM)/Pointed domain [Dermatophagoides farinae]